MWGAALHSKPERLLPFEGFTTVDQKGILDLFERLGTPPPPPEPKHERAYISLRADMKCLVRF